MHQNALLRDMFFGTGRPMHMYLLGTAAAAIIAATLAATAPTAQAGLVIDYSLDGGATRFTLATGASGSAVFDGAATLGVFAVGGFAATSNSPGTATLSKLLSSSLDIQNTSQATASIELAFSDTGFTMPTAPPELRLDSHIGGSITVDNAHNLAWFTSCLSTTDSNLTRCTGAIYVDGPDTPNITASSYDNNQFLGVAPLTGPYSIIRPPVCSFRRQAACIPWGGNALCMPPIKPPPQTAWVPLRR
jgi:hypothetical protein